MYTSIADRRSRFFESTYVMRFICGLCNLASVKAWLPELIMPFVKYRIHSFIDAFNALRYSIDINRLVNSELVIELVGGKYCFALADCAQRNFLTCRRVPVLPVLTVLI